MIRLEPTPITIKTIIDRNTGLSDSTRCSAGVISCKGINCRDCPLSVRTATLGDVRKMDPRIEKQPVDDAVHQPSHYQVFPGLESIEVIARSMTEAEFRGFCMGNTLKYRMRAGKKSDLASIEKDLAKADFYKELFEQHKGKCYVA